MIRTLEGHRGADTLARTEPAARMRVLLVGDFSASKVGNASVAEQLATKLSEAGDVVHVTSDRTDRAARVASMVIDTARHRHAVDVAIVDVYSGAGFRWAEWTTRLLTAAGTPVILVLRAGDLPEFAATARRRVERLFACASSVVALSEYLADAMAEYGPVEKVIPNPIQVADYPYRRRSQVRPRLVWLRTFNRTYNPPLAPRVLAELLATARRRSQGDLPHLTMIGADQRDGSWEMTMAVADELGVRDHLSAPGPVPKSRVPAALAEGDVFLNTSDVDNAPISVVEAMACGLCVVSTDVGGMPYVISDGVDGLLVAKGDATAMAAGVQRVLDNDDLADRLSTNARQRAESLDWDKVLPRWRDHMAHVVMERVRR